MKHDCLNIEIGDRENPKQSVTWQKQFHNDS